MATETGLPAALRGRGGRPPGPFPPLQLIHEMEKQAAENLECPRTEVYNSDLGASWLNFCMQETLLPGKPWHKVSDKLEAALAAELKHQLKDSTQRKTVFHLLGHSFVKRYFGSCPSGSYLLSMRTSGKKKLEEDAVTWLLDQCLKAAERTHCQLPLDAKASRRAPEMVHFLNDIYNVVVAETELLLATCEVQHEEKNAQDSEGYFQASQQPAARNSQQPSMLFKRPRSIESQDICLASFKTPPSQGNGEGACLYIRPTIDPPVLNCPESDLLGDLLCAIITQGSENLSIVCKRLKGKLLPQRLRQFIWITKLLNAGSKSHKAKTLASTEREARVSFGRTVVRRAAELKLRTATQSPLSGLIENAVVEKYHKTPCMSPFATNEQMILEANKTLNISYVFNGIYELYLIHLLFPLQMAFQQITPTDEHPYELAMHLHSLYHNLFPTWAKIHAVAESVMSFLEREDVALFSHLWSSFRKNITVDPEDFLANLRLQEQISAQQTSAFENRSQPVPSIAGEPLEDPTFFLRKWMNEVFLNHPSRLLTADIQKVWIHLQQGGMPADIPGHSSLESKGHNC